MKDKYTIGKIYELEPADIKYDTKICNFNPPKTKESYNSLLSQIEKNGQTQPAFIRNGLLGDGVHRAKVCRQLGIKLKVVDIDPIISDADYILLCNENTFTARNDSPTQLAIKGFKLVNDFGYSDSLAIKNMGLRDKRSISYVRNIIASPQNNKYKIIDTLIKGEVVNIGGTRTKSINTARRLVSRLDEEELNENLRNLVTEPEIDYDSMIHTEIAKEDFWSRQDKLIGYELKIHYIGMLNIIYSAGSVK